MCIYIININCYSLIFWSKYSVNKAPDISWSLGLLSLSADAQNFFLVARIACFNLFRTALYAVQSEVFWVRCARYRLQLRSDISC